MAVAKISLRVALYARVSSEQQAEANTIASQVAELKSRIVADGCTIDEDGCFVDDGVSGTTLIRPALERLRDQVAKRRAGPAVRAFARPAGAQICLPGTLGHEISRAGAEGVR